MARPRKSKSSRLTARLQIMVNAEQLAAITRAAARSSLPASTWVRSVALKAASEGKGEG